MRYVPMFYAPSGSIFRKKQASDDVAADLRVRLVRQEGFEPPTIGLEVRCSILLSYWRVHNHASISHMRPNTMLVSEFAQEWLSNLALLGSVEPSTVRDYRSNMASWSSLLDMELENVTRRDIEAEMRSMLSSGRAPSTVKKRLVTLRRLFDDAVAYGEVEKSPVEGVKNPKLRKNPLLQCVHGWPSPPRP